MTIATERTTRHTSVNTCLDSAQVIPEREGSLCFLSTCYAVGSTTGVRHARRFDVGDGAQLVTCRCSRRSGRHSCRIDRHLNNSEVLLPAQWLTSGLVYCIGLRKLSRPLRNWEFSLTLNLNSDSPLSVQIAQAVVADIQRGRLQPGVRLPGTRTLAETLSVHRNTVLAAYAELLAEGWTDTSEAHGTFVSRGLPDAKPLGLSARFVQREVVPARLVLDHEPQPPQFDFITAPPGMLLMSGGIPDMRLLPVAQLARSYGRVLRRNARAVLSYSRPHGHPRLREALAAMLSTTRGLATGPDDLVVTRGTQMALDLVGRALFRPGDLVVVESLGYRPAWEAFRQNGAELVGVPVDKEGLSVDALERLSEKRRVRAVYVTPHHQYPTTVTMTAGRRVALLRLAQRRRFAIIEDDYDHEFHYLGRPVTPLASSDRSGLVIYLGTLSKILAPGLRLGYVVAPRPLLESIAAHRMYVDRQGDQVLECAVAEMLEDGEVQRHARRTRRVYQTRRLVLADSLRKALGDTLSFELPSGGVALWARASERIDVDAWAARAIEHQVRFFTAKRFAFDGRPRPHVRLEFGGLNHEEINEAVRRLKSAL